MILFEIDVIWSFDKYKDNIKLINAYVLIYINKFDLFYLLTFLNENMNVYVTIHKLYNNNNNNNNNSSRLT